MRKVVLMSDWGADKRKDVLNLEKSYNFVDKAEVVDRLRTWIAEDGRTFTTIANKTGDYGVSVSHTTINNLFSGKTKWPRASTLTAIGKVLGKKLVWVDIKD
jgi:hypothetical protein